ncbi:MAG: hypothetical protein Q4G25_16160 [Paracoccus sp. (in: a-proteobacteria)]|nr:hypothetical protein [Paracoccus sp. (in: a-proteobacteria)]
MRVTILALIAFATPAALSAAPVADLCLDLDPARGGCEQVALERAAADGGDLDLVIRAQTGEELARADGIAWGGPMDGQAPELQRNEAGSLVLLTENTGVGRYGWNQSLTIAFRDGAYLVVGYDYGVFDRISGSTMSCSWNLRTGRQELKYELAEDGKPTKSGAPVTKKAERVAIGDWDARYGSGRPAFCNAGDF